MTKNKKTGVFLGGLYRYTDHKREGFVLLLEGEHSDEVCLTLKNKAKKTEIQIDRECEILTIENTSSLQRYAGEKALFIGKEILEQEELLQGKWEVYASLDCCEGRIEHKKNKRRKHYGNGEKVKPRKEISGIYEDCFHVPEPVFYTNKKTGEEFALVLRYTRDLQLLLQTLPVRDAYLYRTFFQFEKLEEKEGKLVATLGPDNYGFTITRFSVQLREKKEKEYEFRKISDTVYELPVEDVEWEPFFWDFTVYAKKDGREFAFKLRNYKKNFYGQVCKKMGEDLLFSFYTQNNNLILHYRPYSEYDAESYRMLEKKAYRIARLLKPYFAMKQIQLIFEKHCMCAQDNGLALFEYYMKKGGKDKRRTYYIIDKRESDYENLKQYENHIIDFMSLKHMVYLQAAKLLISTDTIKHAYQWRPRNSKVYEKLLTKHSVFLQHGVLALKRVDYIYQKNGGNSTDLFISSTNAEQELIQKYFKYAKKEVPVTGLARWAKLKDKSDGTKILCMPTWRNWMVELSKEEFIKSDYYKYYMDFLKSEQLAKLLEEKKLTMVFLMHPIFREYMDDFSALSDRITLFDYSKKPISEEVMESALMITDYSSVSWDMRYMRKPILFYQFDYERYMDEQGSYIDMTKELYGERATTADELLLLLEKYAENGFAEDKKYADRGEAMEPKRDGLQCKRIDDAIRHHSFTKWQAIGQKILRN